MDPCESQVEISLDHTPPALVDEWYPIRVAISNTEPQAIRAVTLAFGLDSNQDDEMIETAAVAVVPSDHEQQDLWESSVEQHLHDMDPGQQVQDLLIVVFNVCVMHAIRPSLSPYMVSYRVWWICWYAAHSQLVGSLS